MKINIRYILVVSSICISTIASAQIPGYLGKKIAIGYAVNSGLPFAASFMNYAPSVNYNGKELAPHYTFRHNFLLECAIGRGISVEGGIGFSKSGMFSYDREPEYFEYEYPGLSNDFDDFQQRSSRSYDYTIVSNRFYKIGVNLFKGAYVAPHGTYWNFSYAQNIGTVSFVLNNQSTDFSIVTNHVFLVSKGFRHIIYNSFIIDYGFGFGYTVGPDGLGENRSSSSSNGPIYEGSLERNQTNLLNSAILFNAHIGIKYLIPKFY